MSKFSRFMKANKIAQKNEKFAPTQSLRDENGKPLEWEFKKISAKENEEIREACTMEVQVKGKPNMFRPKVKTSEYLAKMIAASVVYPDLYDKELQDRRRKIWCMRWWIMRENIRSLAFGCRISKGSPRRWTIRWMKQKTN